MSPKSIDKILPPVRIEIRPSKLLPGEVGMFAVRPLKKDSIVIDAKHYSGLRLISWKDFKKFDAITREKIMGYCPGTPEGFFAPKDLNYLSIAWHMNHSCNPNIGFSANDDFIAMRNIKAGEELCWDYGFDEPNPAFKMSCKCGQRSCRKVVTGNDWKVLMKDKKKYHYFSPRLKKFIARNNKGL